MNESTNLVLAWYEEEKAAHRAAQNKITELVAELRRKEREIAMLKAEVKDLREDKFGVGWGEVK